MSRFAPKATELLAAANRRDGARSGLMQCSNLRIKNDFSEMALVGFSPYSPTLLPCGVNFSGSKTLIQARRQQCKKRMQKFSTRRPFERCRYPRAAEAQMTPHRKLRSSVD